MTPETHWGPGIIVVVAGVVVALVLLFLARKKTAPIEEKDDRLADHERKVQALLEQLRELNQDSHLMPEADFKAEKARLEAEAAAALRARDEYAGALVTANRMAEKAAPGKKAEAAPAPAGFLAQNPQLKGALWGASIVGFFVLLGLLLTQETKPREEMGGGPMTGGGSTSAMGGQQQNAAMDAEEHEFQELQKKLQQNPDDLELSARVAHELLRRQDFNGAGALTDRALTIDPFHTEARVHHEVLRGLKGDAMGALDQLEKIGKAQPDGDEALLFAGALAMEVNDPRRALRNFESYASITPPNEQPPQLAQGIALLRQQVAQLDGKTVEPVPGPNMPNGANQNGPPPLTQEQMQAFQQMQNSPEFVKAAEDNVVKAEEDLAAGRYQDALDKYKQVMPVMPNNSRAKAGMAWALIGLNKQPMADRVWGVAVESDPAAVDALGDALKAKGNGKDAQALWKKLADSAPGWQGVESVKKKLQ